MSTTDNRLAEWTYRETLYDETQADAEYMARRIAERNVPGATATVVTTHRTKGGRWSMLVTVKR